MLAKGRSESISRISTRTPRQVVPYFEECHESYTIILLRQVIEYCLFQAGMFVDYFASPYKTTKHIHPFQNQFDFNKRRAIVLEGAEDATLSLITAHDFCAVVAQALDYQGTWPVIGGIVGERVTVKQLLAIGEKIRTSSHALADH
jgi:hypothetical protein